MAYIYAKTAGNWLTAANWQGGSVPTSSDDVFLNGLSMTINGDVDVKSINNNYATVIAPSSLTGTITTSISSTTVTGSGTLFTTELVVGQTLKTQSGSSIGVIQSITNNTTLVLTANSSTAVTGSRYVVSASTTSLTGTITTSNASTTITGIGTLFTQELQPGVVIRNTAGASLGTISTIASDTSLTLTGNAASNNTNIAYVAGTTSGTATVTLSTGFNPSITIGINGIFSAITNHVLQIAGTISGATFSLTCKGTINGTSTASFRGINITSSNQTITLNTRNLYGNTGEAIAVANTSSASTINVISSGYEVIGGGSPAVLNNSTNTAVILKCILLKGGNSTGGFGISANNSTIQSIGTIDEPIVDITPSTTGPAVFAYVLGQAALNTTQLNIYCTNLNTSGNPSNSIDAITANKYTLNASTIKYYNQAGVEVPYNTTTGTIPSPEFVVAGVEVGETVGTLVQPDPASVLQGTSYGVISDTNSSPRTGTLNIATEVWGAAVKQITSIASGGITNASLADNVLSASKIAQSTIGTNIGAGTDAQSIRMQNGSTDASTGALIQSLT